nr:ABC transporter substrate-binding protein [Enterovibrio nigricans]
MKKHGKDFGRHPSGTGPFRFAEWASNTKVVVVRNDNYWGIKRSSKRLYSALLRTPIPVLLKCWQVASI